jgi:hypothetical protein
MRRPILSLTLVALIALLAACTGGGGGPDATSDPELSGAASSDAASSGTAAAGEPTPECAAAFEPLAEMELATTSGLGDLAEIEATVEACASLADWTAGAQTVVDAEINPNVVEILLGLRCESPSLSGTPVCEDLG